MVAGTEDGQGKTEGGAQIKLFLTLRVHDVLRKFKAFVLGRECSLPGGS